MISIFAEVILPVFLVFSVGYIGQRLLKLDIKSISSLAIYILMPTLVFRTFYTIDLNLQYFNMVLFNLGLLFSIVFVISFISKIRKYSSSVKNGLILSTGFMNSGNYGAPIILFAFGQEGFNLAISFVVLQTIFMNSFGVYYAAKGETGFKTAIKSVLKIPAIYSFFAAVLWKYLQIPLSDNFYGVIDLVANATIPTVMIVLGMQLSQIKVTRIDWEKVSLGMVVRLVLSPIIAFAITSILPFDPLLQKVLIISSAMPTAATTTMLAVQFNTEPKLVSSITLLTTLLSIVTLSALLTLI